MLLLQLPSWIELYVCGGSLFLGGSSSSISNLHFLFFFFNQAFPDFVKITLEDTIEGFVSSQMTFNDAKEQFEEILWKLEEEIDDNNN